MSGPGFADLVRQERPCLARRRMSSDVPRAMRAAELRARLAFEAGALNARMN